MNDFPIIVSISNEYFDRDGNLIIGKQIDEAMHKPSRPYLEGTLVADSKNTYFVPFWTHINRKFAESCPNAIVSLATDEKPDAGLDLSKTIIVDNELDFHINKSGIDANQYRILQGKRAELVGKVENYMSNYRHEVLTGQKLSPEYKYSTLKNFHEELGLPPYQESKREKQNELTNDELERRREFARRNRGLGR